MFLGFEGCAGLARKSRSSSGARSKRRMMDCISSAVGASIKANPFDSWVSWLRITLIESATRSSAVNHCLISSAVTQVGRFPKKTVKLIQSFCSLRLVGFRHFKGKDSDLPVRWYQTESIDCKRGRQVRNSGAGGGGDSRGAHRRRGRDERGIRDRRREICRSLH